MLNFRLYSASFVSFYKMYCKALTLTCSMCRWGRGEEHPGPCALWVDPEGPQLCGGPRFARGSQPEEALRVWHQDTDEDPGAEPPHPVHSKKVSAKWEHVVHYSLIRCCLGLQTAVWTSDHESSCFTSDHSKNGKEKGSLASLLYNALQRYNWKPITVLGSL